jgi:hypothetical protein
MASGKRRGTSALAARRYLVRRATLGRWLRHLATLPTLGIREADMLKSLATRYLKRPIKKRNRVAEIGWLLMWDRASLIFDAPHPLFRKDPPPKHAKSASFCPAIVDHESRIYEVSCPFDLQLRCAFENSKFGVSNTDGDMAAVQKDFLARVVHPTPREKWRHPDRPIVQLECPYLFVADEPVYMTQMPPFAFYRDPAPPGILYGGRFPIHIWARKLSWAFEWHDVTKPLILRRGEPWFYVRFETEDPSRAVRLVEATLTPELKRYIESIDGVTNFVRRTFSLFDTAELRRPPSLLVKR